MIVLLELLATLLPTISSCTVSSVSMISISFQRTCSNRDKVNVGYKYRARSVYIYLMLSINQPLAFSSTLWFPVRSLPLQVDYISEIADNQHWSHITVYDVKPDESQMGRHFITLSKAEVRVWNLTGIAQGSVVWQRQMFYTLQHLMFSIGRTHGDVLGSHA